MTEAHKQGYQELNKKAGAEEHSPSASSPHHAPPQAPKFGVNDLYAFARILVGRPLHLLLLTVPLAMAAPRYHIKDDYVFALNFVAILPLAALLGTATEELAGSVGETMGGLLNATFGNAVEMILSVFALREGLIDVVQGSLLGSILSNLLLVLGMCFFFGGVYNHTQKYNPDGARVMSSLLLLSVLALIMPSLASTSNDNNQEVDLLISRGAAVVLGCLYCFYLLFQIFTHPEHFKGSSEAEEEAASMSPWSAAIMLLACTLIVAVCSEGLVGSVEGMTERLGISRPFVGVVLLPIVGNAAEHVTAVTVAMKDKLDLSLGVALGSSLQIALLVVPFTVVTGWILGVPMSLNFSPVGTGILLLTVLIVGNLTSDGESNWLEGAMLLAAYLLVGVTFWFMQ